MPEGTRQVDKLIRELSLSLLLTAGGVGLLFMVGALSRKYKIDWLTKFLTQPPEKDRPPGWIVVAAGALLMTLTLVWFSLTTEQQRAFRLFIVGP